MSNTIGLQLQLQIRIWNSVLGGLGHCPATITRGEALTKSWILSWFILWCAWRDGQAEIGGSLVQTNMVWMWLKFMNGHPSQYLPGLMLSKEQLCIWHSCSLT